MAIGVEQSIVWATARGTVGVCGYALIPAEGHPWSRKWPIDRDQPEAQAETTKLLAQFNDALLYHDGDSTKAMEVFADQPARDYMDDYLDVHGGVSWYTHPWVGFDCGHSWDVWTKEWDPNGLCERYRESERPPYATDWTPELVAEEARRLARQVAEVAHLEKILDIEAGT